MDRPSTACATEHPGCATNNQQAGGTSSHVVQTLSQKRDVLPDFLVVLNGVGDLHHRMHRGCMVPAAKLLSNVRERASELFPHEVHGNLSRDNQPLFPAVPDQLVKGQVIERRNDVQDVFCGYATPLRTICDGGEQRLRALKGGLDVIELVICDDAVQGTLKFADI